jgi:serine/threonine-protein kinase
MVMALLKGQTLRSCLRDARNVRAPIPAHNMWVVLSQLCEGLHVLHSQPVPMVHGDVKPENVFLQKVENVAGGASVRLLDFGLARAAGESFRVLVGTPRYMPPELIRGDPVGERADQYATAMIVYEMLTGRLPWDVSVRDHDAVMQAHVSREPAPPSTFCAWVPQAVDDAILRALRKDPLLRWGSIADFASAMRGLEDVNDGSAYANVNVNTTAPDLATMTVGSDEYRLAHDTDEMPPLEVLGGSWRSSHHAAVTVPGDPAVIAAARQACRDEGAPPVVVRPIVELTESSDPCVVVDVAWDSQEGNPSTDSKKQQGEPQDARSLKQPTAMEEAEGTEPASDQARPWVVPVKKSPERPRSPMTRLRPGRLALFGWMLLATALTVAAGVVVRAGRDQEHVGAMPAAAAPSLPSGEASAFAGVPADLGEWAVSLPLGRTEAPAASVASLSPLDAVPSAVALAKGRRPLQPARSDARRSGANEPGLGEFKATFGVEEAIRTPPAKGPSTGANAGVGRASRRNGPTSSTAAEAPDDGRDLF